MPLPSADLPTRARGSEALRLGATWLVGVIIWGYTGSTTSPEPTVLMGAWLFIVDPLLGGIALTVSHWRHRWPVPVALFTALVTVASWTAAGPALLTLASIGTRRRVREMTVVGTATVVTGLLAERFYNPAGAATSNWWGLFGTAIGITVTVLAIGYAVGSRREVLQSLRDRARSAELEQSARIAAAQVAERARIAREMHDALAHRISLIAMNASALSYRSDLPRDQQLETIASIEENARLALGDLRDVLGVLRDPGTATLSGQDREAPQPTLSDLPELVRQTQSAGSAVDLFDDTREPGPGVTTARTAYRIVQEGLTNARKHAPHARVQIRLTGDDAAGLTVQVTSARSVAGPVASIPGAGYGLVGLRERAELAGGRLTHGFESDGTFVLAVWLPWE